MIAGGGGGLGIGRYLDDEIQQARGFVPDKQDMSGQVLVDDQVPAGPGGGWRPRQETALDPHYGASLLEGARGGIACYETAGKHGFGGFGGGKKAKFFFKKTKFVLREWSIYPGRQIYSFSEVNLILVLIYIFLVYKIHSRRWWM